MSVVCSARRYCTDGSDSSGATLAFGSTGSDSSTVRALFDPNDALQGTFTFDTYSSCCSANRPYDVCNAPYDNNGGEIDDATALCYALGYAVGTLVAYSTSNGCPEVSASVVTRGGGVLLPRASNEAPPANSK